MHNALRKPVVRILLLAVLAALIAAAFFRTAPALQQRPVTVFAASSLQNVLTDAGRAYKSKTGRTVHFSFAASSALARQIESGAPADIFVSADADWMDYVAQRRLIARSTRTDLISNRLALITPASAPTNLKIARNMRIAQALGRDGRLALAAPEVPAGKYATAALTSLGVWQSVENRTVRAENVRAAMQFVARGEAPLGIVYDTDAILEPRVKIVGLFPAGSHPAIVYPAALTRQTSNADAAAFLTWLRSAEAGAIFARHGFTRPSS